MNFDQYIDRRPFGSVKWASEMMPFWVADTDFRAPDEVCAALREVVEHGVFGYENIPEDLFENVVAWECTRHGHQAKAEYVTAIPGVISGLTVAVQTFTEPGDKVLINTPIYPPFYYVIRDNARIVADAPIRYTNGRYELDFDMIEESLRDVRLWLFCSPHNPTGRCFTRDELKKVAELCERYDVILVSDEIHNNVIFPGHKHVPMATIDAQTDARTITLISPAKAFSLAGFSTAFSIISNPDIRERFQNTVNRNCLHLNAMGLRAANAAYRYGAKYIDDLTDYLYGNMQYAIEFFAEHIPGIKPVIPEATYLMWLDCAGLNPGETLLDDYFRSRGLFLCEGEQYLPRETNRFMRFNFACTRDILRQGLERMKI